MQKIIPNLWFGGNGKEAVEFYTSVFNGGKILNTTYYPEAGHDIHGMDAGDVLTVEFEIEGYRFLALNATQEDFKPNPSVSFMVNFDPSQDKDARKRLDEVWEKLLEGGEVAMPIGEYPFSERYGWVRDKYGFSWQLILTDPEGEKRPPVIPSLLFVTDSGEQAEEATDFYLSVFKNTKRGAIARYPAGMPARRSSGAGGEPNKEGAIMFTDFMLEGQWFAAMDGSTEMHNFTFNESVSFMVYCKDQQEVDELWNKLSAVPESEQCGWLKDKYGVSWQIVPAGMDEMLNDPDKEKANRAMDAMLKMKKLDLEELKKAYEG